MKIRPPKNTEKDAEVLQKHRKDQIFRPLQLLFEVFKFRHFLHNNSLAGKKAFSLRATHKMQLSHNSTI